MEFKVQPISESDLPTVFAMMTVFAEHEKLSEYLDLDLEGYKNVMFGPRAFVEGLLALADDEPVGLALFYPCFATFLSSPGMFLEDLFVSERARGKGVGDLLIREVARRARSLGFERIDLHVRAQNASAIEFYKRRGGDCDNGDLHFRFVNEAFAKLAE